MYLTVVVVHACNPSNLEAEEFKASLIYTAVPGQ